MDDQTLVCRSHRAVYRRLADGEGGVLLHLESAAYHSVNEMGTVIWDVIEPGVTVASLIETLGHRLDTAPADWRQDVKRFLSDLARRDLVVLEPAGAVRGR